MIHRLLCRLLFHLAPFVRSYLRTFALEVHRADGSVETFETWRFSNEIFAASERDHFALVVPTLRASFTTLIAPGRDGDYFTALAEGLGHHVIRGSSRHSGHAALYALAKALRERPGPAALAVDGPLGPVGQAKGGVLVLAALSGRPIVPSAAAAKRRIDFRRTWSGLYLPLPFTRVVVVCGEPFSVPEVPASGRDDLLEELTARIARARREALDLLQAESRRENQTAGHEAARP